MSRPIVEATTPRTIVRQGFGQQQLERRPAAAGGTGGSIEVALPINLTNPQVSGAAVGNSFPNVISMSGGDHGGWSMRNGVDSFIYGTVAIPSSYQSGGVIRMLFGAQSSTGTVRLKVGSHTVSVGDAYDPTSYTVETAQNISVGTVNQLQEGQFTLTNPPVANDLLFVELIREGSSGSDTLADLLLLFGAWLEVTLG